jgi:hypothetical protein
MLHSENFATVAAHRIRRHHRTEQLGTHRYIENHLHEKLKRLCGRLRATLGMEHRFDHTGFETHTGIDDAFVAFEPIRSKTKEWIFSVWFQTLL